MPASFVHLHVRGQHLVCGDADTVGAFVYRYLEVSGGRHNVEFPYRKFLFLQLGIDLCKGHSST